MNILWEWWEICKSVCPEKMVVSDTIFIHKRIHKLYGSHRITSQRTTLITTASIKGLKGQWKTWRKKRGSWHSFRSRSGGGQDDCEKAFDSVDRRTIWNLLRYQGMPEKTVTTIRKFLRWITLQRRCWRVAHRYGLWNKTQYKVCWITTTHKGDLFTPYTHLFLAIS